MQRFSIVARIGGNWIQKQNASNWIQKQNASNWIQKQNAQWHLYNFPSPIAERGISMTLHFS